MKLSCYGANCVCVLREWHRTGYIKWSPVYSRRNLLWNPPQTSTLRKAGVLAGQRNTRPILSQYKPRSSWPSGPLGSPHSFEQYPHMKSSGFPDSFVWMIGWRVSVLKRPHLSNRPRMLTDIWTRPFAPIHEKHSIWGPFAGLCSKDPLAPLETEPYNHSFV